MTEAEIPSKTFSICPACDKQRHLIFDCSVFNGLDTKGHLKVVSDEKRCSNCFRSFFFCKCHSKYNCKHCSRRQHSMIHPGPFEATTEGRNTSSADESPCTSTVITAVPASTPEIVSMMKSSNANVPLTTVVLIVVDIYGQERLCQQLQLLRQVVNV